MNKALQLVFWGYLFVFFRLQAGIDLLAAPIGYYLIYAGARRMEPAVARKVEITAFIGMLVSVPGVFVNLSEVTGGWLLYAEGLFIWKMIVVYCLFGTWSAALQGAGHSLTRKRVRIAYGWYMGVHFLLLLMTAISPNFGTDDWDSAVMTVNAAVAVMDVVLLMVIAFLRRADWKETEKEPSL